MKLHSESDRPMLGGLLIFGVIVLISMGVILHKKSSSIEVLAQNWSQRIEKAIASDSAAKLLAELNQSIEKSPNSSELHMARGMLYFRTGQIKPSVEDFDKVVKISPKSAPFLWQRGIALYYAGKFEEGKKQFELHQTVNPNDVENAFWHFLCAAKLVGAEEASKNILVAGEDSRPPLMEVQEMIAGRLQPDKVLQATEHADDSGKFYGFLYLGLYFDALGNRETSKTYLRNACEIDYPGYMHDVAKHHLWTLSNHSDAPPSQK